MLSQLSRYKQARIHSILHTSKKPETWINSVLINIHARNQIRFAFFKYFTKLTKMAAKLHSPTHSHSLASVQKCSGGGRRQGAWLKGGLGGKGERYGRESDIANSWMSTTLAERTPLDKLKMKGTRPPARKKGYRKGYKVLEIVR